MDLIELLESADALEHFSPLRMDYVPCTFNAAEVKTRVDAGPYSLYKISLSTIVHWEKVRSNNPDSLDKGALNPVDVTLNWKIVSLGLGVQIITREAMQLLEV